MSRTHTIGRRATAVFTDDDGMTNVVYHETAVVKFDARRVHLNTGGWRTLTTRTRMNQAANQFKLGFQVFQKDFQWYVKPDNGEAVAFDRRASLKRIDGALKVVQTDA